MPRQLDRAELEQRFSGQGNDLVIQVASLLQGGVLSAAAFSLIEIFRMQDDMLVRMVLWLTSVSLGLAIFFRICQRSPFLTRAGNEVLYMVPIMGLFEIVLFVILTSDTLGPASWRYWFVAATLFSIAGVLANWLNLKATRREHFADDAEDAYTTYAALVRRAFYEAIVVAVVSALLSVWMLLMRPDWPYALAFVVIHMALSLAGLVISARTEVRVVEDLRARLDI